MTRKGLHQLELITLPEAARRAGLGIRQLRRASRSGELPCYRVGGWERVRWTEVLAWLERQRVHSPTVQGGPPRSRAGQGQLKQLIEGPRQGRRSRVAP